MKNSIYLAFIGVGYLMMFSNISHAAGIYKCTKANGNIFYNDKPCAAKDIEKKLNAVKDVAGGYIPLTIEAEVSQKRSTKAIVRHQKNDNKKNTLLKRSSAKKSNSGSSSKGNKSRELSYTKVSKSSDNNSSSNSNSGQNISNDTNNSASSKENTSSTATDEIGYIDTL